MSGDPEAPQNVRIRYVDGTEGPPLPLIYLGWDPHQLVHRWEVCCPAEIGELFASRRCALALDYLPGHTGVVVAFESLRE